MHELYTYVPLYETYAYICTYIGYRATVVVHTVILLSTWLQYTYVLNHATIFMVLTMIVQYWNTASTKFLHSSWHRALSTSLKILGKLENAWEHSGEAANADWASVQACEDDDEILEQSTMLLNPKLITIKASAK